MLNTQETPWLAEIEVTAKFQEDGREENLFEITNKDHSETFGYVVSGEAAALFVAAPKLLKRLEDNLQFLIAWRYEYASKPNDTHNNEQRDRIDAAYKETVALIAEARGTKQVQS